MATGGLLNIKDLGEGAYPYPIFSGERKTASASRRVRHHQRRAEGGTRDCRTMREDDGADWLRVIPG